jgi:hypothetical protein
VEATEAFGGRPPHGRVLGLREEGRFGIHCEQLRGSSGLYSRGFDD